MQEHYSRPKRNPPREQRICALCGTPFSRPKWTKITCCSVRCGVINRWNERRRSTEERFWEKVDKAGPTPAHIPALGPCWVWTGSTDTRGYGQLRMYGQKNTVRAHRLSWIFANGAIPPGVGVLHKCDNPTCVKPDHLFLGTQAMNMADAARKGRIASGSASGNHTQPDGRTKLTADAVRAIRLEYARYYRGLCAVLAARYGVSVVTIRFVGMGISWKHIA